jgi:hypothetical protein
MKSILKILILWMLWAFSWSGLFAQGMINTAGNDAIGEGGSVSWSIGLVAFSAWGDMGGNITEGVQQPYEIFIMPGLQEVQTNSFFLVFPNPTDGNVNLKILDTKLKDLSYRIYDTEGREFRRLALITDVTAIPMNDLKPGTYYLVILVADYPIKTYKIINK